MALLELDGVRAAYGLSQVLFGVSFRAERAEVVALLGRNGVGKTTTLRTIIGLTRLQAGSIRWRDRDIGGLPPYRIARLGVGFVPEDRRIFPDLTVWENLDIARRPRADGEGWTEAAVYDLFPKLYDLRFRRGGYLSGGEQQMLTIGRSLMGNPDLLLLDEPSEGLAPLIVAELRERIGRLRDLGLTIVLAEQNLGFVLALSNRVYILEKGEVKFGGTPDDLRADPALQRRYLTV